jgi:hypothetical protein
MKKLKLKFKNLPHIPKYKDIKIGW